MTIDEAHEKLQEWYDDDCVGSLIIFRSPRAKNVDMIAEETIKLFEMDSEQRELVQRTYNAFGTESLVVKPDKRGYPDRVTVTRRM